jgi:hypothetical protein
VTVFTPLTLKLGDQAEIIVWNLTQLADALKQSWPNKRSSSYRKTARLVTGAIHGHCTPSAAYTAFMALAVEQKVLQPNVRNFRGRSWRTAPNASRTADIL